MKVLVFTIFLSLAVIEKSLGEGPVSFEQMGSFQYTTFILVAKLFTLSFWLTLLLGFFFENLFFLRFNILPSLRILL